MKLSYGGQCGRNGFMAYVGSGNRPVLGVFHEIRCHQTNIRTFIRKDSNHAGTSADFTVQSLDHIGRRDFSSVQHGKCIKSQRIFQSVFKALNRFPESAWHRSRSHHMPAFSPAPPWAPARFPLVPRQRLSSLSAAHRQEYSA